MVPVTRMRKIIAQRLSDSMYTSPHYYLTVAAEVDELLAARARKLRPEEMTGGTFTVSNLGMFGVKEFAAIINPPEAAILAVGAVRKEPVVLADDSIAVRQRMRLTLSCDHRVIDGAVGAAFLRDLADTIQNPVLALA